MEKTKMNYQNGKIYTIRSYQTDDVYYGSTTQPLSKRLSGHKAHYKQWQKQNYNYVTSFEMNYTKIILAIVNLNWKSVKVKLSEKMMMQLTELLLVEQKKNTEKIMLIK
jgi:hypothetical protein